MKSAKQYLPEAILRKAILRGNEYAWPVDSIPEVIELGQKANLLNIGGQLQFRIPDGTCECYWVNIDTYKSVSSDLPWQERVRLSAEVAQKEFQTLKAEKNFATEADKWKEVKAYLSKGGSLNDVICFAWYLSTEEEEKSRTS